MSHDTELSPIVLFACLMIAILLCAPLLIMEAIRARHPQAPISYAIIPPGRDSE